MPTNPSALPTIPPFPALSDRAAGTYNSKAYTWATEWDTIIAPALETLAETTYDNAVEAAASSTLAVQNTGTAIGYTFDTATADADPGAGKLRLNNATQNTATVIRADNTSAAGSDVAALLATFGTGTSTVKGRLRIQHATDATKWLIFDVTAVASPSGYKNITATCTGFSAASPFANGDALAVSFSTTGDKGDTGATGPAGTFGGTATSTAEFLTGANIASASTVNLNAATGNRVHITGTTAITAWTLTRGPRTVIFDGVLTLTHHATNNNLPGGANITTAAGDRAIYESDGTTVYCVGYFRKDGTALVTSGVPGVVQIGSSVVATGAAAALLNSGFSSTYDTYDLVITGVVSVANAELRLRMELGGSVVTTSTYQYNQISNTTNNAVTNASPGAYVAILNSGAGAADSFTLTIRITKPSSTSLKKLITWAGAAVRTETTFFSGNAINTGTSALTGIQVYPDSGTITCTMTLFGVTK